MTPAEKFIERLQVCRPSGKGKWIAQCPAHDDRSPSLSVKEAEDGRLLIHCHAGCGANDVIASLGLEFDDLYPETDRERYDPIAGRRIQKSERQYYYEAQLHIYESMRRQGEMLTDSELKKEREAYTALRRMNVR